NRERHQLTPKPARCPPQARQVERAGPGLHKAERQNTSGHYRQHGAAEQRTTKASR
ncbi:Hypothetical predicted protein, partial [Pelobates cultripes]